MSEPIDWQARALAAERDLADLRMGAGIVGAATTLQIDALKRDLVEAVTFWEAHLNGLSKRRDGHEDGGMRMEREKIAAIRERAK